MSLRGLASVLKQCVEVEGPRLGAMGSCASVKMEDAGLGWRAAPVRERVGEVCVGEGV